MAGAAERADGAIEGETLSSTMDEVDLGGGRVAVLFEVSRRRVSKRDNATRN